ncbi:hypothetical protein AA0120_g8480 [Alternaria tenuissima]|jgi:hypothetical protein|nr:hypothetical protein AA0120_g8480 [Alternaria tenuissima]
MSKRSISSPSPPPEAKRLQKVNKGLANTIYEPLPQGEFIRVLKLQPGKAEDDIQCSLETIGIGTSKDAYEAISYVWGDVKHTVDVWCNGLQVPITASLASALRNFRHHSEPRLLWADALCINQKDDQEKGHQVKRMGQVYANAKCVLVWLGCDVNNVAADTFALICEANAYFGGSFAKARNKARRMELFEKPYPISIDQDRWSGVVKLFKFPWFERVWTVQEVAVAAECRMFWGSANVDVADVLEICVWFWAKQDFYVTVRDIVGSIKRRSRKSIALYFQYNTNRPVSWQQSRAGLTHIATLYKEQTLCGILRTSRKLKATDPRDHVYAFLGCPVAKDGDGRTLVDADYTPSILVLNIRLACALMKNPTEGPIALSAVCHESRESLLNSGYPSWVPAWHVPGQHRVRIMDPSYWYRAGGSTKFFTTISPDEEDFLTVGGFVFDKVIWSSNTIQGDMTGLSYTHPNPAAHGSDELPIDTLLNHVFQTATGLGLAIRREDIVCTLKLGYPARSSSHSFSHRRQKKELEAYRRKTRLARSSGVETAEWTIREKYHALNFEKTLGICNRQKVFLTENGRLGIIPVGKLVETGDVCCIIFGATVPFLLTPAKDGRHRLISNCYIHGAMDGAVVQQFAGSDLSDCRIIIE